MDKIILVLGVIALLAAIAVVVYDRLKLKKTLDNIEEMIDMTMNDGITAEHFDESRLSKLESKLADFISRSSISAQNVKDERDKIKSLISDISHQTKTPIANLILYSELLEGTELPKDAESNVKAIHSQAEKLRFLIDSLVKLSRLENGILELTPVNAKVGPVIESVCRQLGEKAETKGLLIRFEGTDSEAVFDEKWTYEALVNIVDNAVKYTNECGKITVSCDDYEMFTRIDIKDTGIGIPEEEYTEVFKRFYRGKAVKNQEGVGIGLHLAREIISGEGGYIKLSSEVGKGTTFSVFLPKKPIPVN